MKILSSVHQFFQSFHCGTGLYLSTAIMLIITTRVATSTARLYYNFYIKSKDNTIKGAVTIINYYYRGEGRRGGKEGRGAG